MICRFPSIFWCDFIVDCNLQVLIYWERVVLHFPRILYIQQMIWTETEYLQHVFCSILWNIVSPDTWVYTLCTDFAHLKSGFKIQHGRNKISHINYKMSSLKGMIYIFIKMPSKFTLKTCTLKFLAYFYTG